VCAKALGVLKWWSAVQVLELRQRGMGSMSARALGALKRSEARCLLRLCWAPELWLHGFSELDTTAYVRLCFGTCAGLESLPEACACGRPNRFPAPPLWPWRPSLRSSPACTAAATRTP
jgi:hypothetical protein